ncbi:MAG: T9SS type A sorting domain-containing protein [Bacteroidetes bacterium]|nr:T9SS type A sorting domain-containing protein [Bacteroidota bacterium]
MRVLAVLFVCSVQLLTAWGSVGHRIINKNAVLQLPPTMQRFITDSAFLRIHSTDADTRRTSDTAMFSEQYRHYLDVDEYPDFHNLDRSFDTLVQKFGWMRVKENGTNPWTTVTVMDSLTKQLKRGDWTAALQSAADLGHYVGDPHQPLHATVNYDGQLTNNKGIHSRYETTMLGRFQGELVFTKDSLTYVDDVYGYAFSYILESNALIDSIFRADSIAKAVSGYTGSGTAPAQYYDTLWKYTSRITRQQIRLASARLASLWYTAWVNAGLIAGPQSVQRLPGGIPAEFELYQNHPNPFNPSTTIGFAVAKQGHVHMEIVTMDGRLITRLIDETLEPGTYSARWNGSAFASGTYLCRVQMGGRTLTKKLLLTK